MECFDIDVARMTADCDAIAQQVDRYHAATGTVSFPQDDVYRLMGQNAFADETVVMLSDPEQVEEAEKLLAQICQHESPVPSHHPGIVGESSFGRHMSSRAVQRYPVAGGKPRNNREGPSPRRLECESERHGGCRTNGCRQAEADLSERKKETGKEDSDNAGGSASGMTLECTTIIH